METEDEEAETEDKEGGRGVAVPASIALLVNDKEHPCKGVPRLVPEWPGWYQCSFWGVQDPRILHMADPASGRLVGEGITWCRHLPAKRAPEVAVVCGACLGQHHTHIAGCRRKRAPGYGQSSKRRAGEQPRQATPPLLDVGKIFPSS